MRVLYDLWASQPLQGQFHGGGTHALAVLEGLLDTLEDEEITAFHDPRRWLDPRIVERLRSEEIPLVEACTKTDLQQLLDSGTFDRFYSSLPYDLYDLDLGGLDVVMTIHGLRPLEVPADRYEFRFADGWGRRIRTAMRQLSLPVYVRWQRNRLRRLIHSASRTTSLLVPSLHTKHALLGMFPEVDPDQVAVAYSPLRQISESVSPDLRLLTELELEERGYFLLVNAGRWIKNAQRAIMALDRFFEARPDVRLRVLLVGVEPGQALSNSPRHPDRFVFQDYVPSPTLEALYAHAFALLYPSLNEGFGYPPVEAMRWGTPVICSAVASLPEVCDAAALYVNPTSVAEIENRVSQLVLEPGLWSRYAEKGPKRHAEVEMLQSEGLQRICTLILGRDG